MNRTLVLLGGAHVHLPDHIAHLQARGWRIGAVHDRDAERRDTLCARLNARALPDLAALPTDAAGALVCSETVHHEADITAALNAGLPVFTEKPLAGSAAAAARCAALAQRTGIDLQSGYFFRTNAALKALKAAVDEGELGIVHEARMRFSHDGGFADWLDLDCWMTDPALACYDGFVDEAVHCVDLLQWLLGPARTGHAITANALGWAVDDHGAAVLRFESGATATIEAGWTDAAMRLEIDLVGDAGHARLQDGQLTIRTRGDDVPVRCQTLSELDAGEGIEPFLDTLEGRTNDARVSPEEAASVNAMLDRMGLRLDGGTARD
ncbi:Gfo/Idh/MocA family protein [Citreimonas salinaria]|uniref:Myo-inositol 2-dehydrogenase / D-chiro-inositol 1-dehydrogenase n=1 Tax=Citreimonas salinaria TaxID=321339 RepID=A0A1H3J479_9RHOB|nr:Gfo/Idh/MocA family oxidoreductase [Citreimonas salinaria]SDY34736.1 myo-inositol 2-dehydrogenase / D-chiro-inositol 1-dehydrogenase [Citreimonas salinaria]